MIGKLILKNEETSNKKDSDILSFSSEEYGFHQYLENKNTSNLNEKEGFRVELSVEDKNPYVASQIAKIAKNILQESNIDFKIKNINATYKFIRIN